MRYEFLDAKDANFRGWVAIILALIVWVALIIKFTPAFELPHIRNNPTNLLAIVFLLIFSFAMMALTIRNLWILLFEITSVHVEDDGFLVNYRSLPSRRFDRSLRFNLRLNVKLLDPAVKAGFRNVHVLSNSLFTCIVVPAHTDYAQPLVSELIGK